MIIKSNLKKKLKSIISSDIKEACLFSVSPLCEKQRAKLIADSLFLNYPLAYSQYIEDCPPFITNFLSDNDLIELLFDCSCVANVLDRSKIKAFFESNLTTNNDDSLEYKICSLLNDYDELRSSQKSYPLESFISYFPTNYSDAHSLFTSRHLFESPRVDSKEKLLNLLSDFHAFNDLGIKDVYLKLTCNNGMIYFVGYQEIKGKLYCEILSNRGNKDKLKALKNTVQELSKKKKVTSDTVLDATNILELAFDDIHFSERIKKLREISGLAKEYYEE